MNVTKSRIKHQHQVGSTCSQQQLEYRAWKPRRWILSLQQILVTHRRRFLLLIWVRPQLLLQRQPQQPRPRQQVPPQQLQRLHRPQHQLRRLPQQLRHQLEQYFQHHC